jgi:phage baseplate assembly protein gpV
MSAFDDLNRDAQAAASAETAIGAAIENRLKDVHTVTPGIIEMFDENLQTATVQPAIKRVFTERGAVNLPVCVDVPVAFPGGGGFFLTFPVKHGDECILLFSERCIDGWYCDGGVAPPEEYRMHDLSDGIAIVGLNSQPQRIPVFNGSDVQLRTREGETHITVKPDGTITAVNSAGDHTLCADGSMEINAPAGTTINSPNITLNGNVLFIGNFSGQAGNGGDGNASLPGTLTAENDVIGGGISLKGHTHTGVQPGGGSTGKPE